MQEALNTVIINAATTVLIVSTCVWICRAFKWAPVNITINLTIPSEMKEGKEVVVTGPFEDHEMKGEVINVNANHVANH